MMHANEHPRPDPQDWRTRAECRNHPELPWFVELKFRGELDKAAATYGPICRTCPVYAECEDAGRNTPADDLGIYAGVPSIVLRAGGRVVRTFDRINHGTLGGLRDHYRYNVKPVCDLCRDAKNADDRKRRAAERAQRQAVAS